MNDKPDIYFDHQSTTPCDPRVVEAMLPYFSKEFGNPSSHIHTKGVVANQVLDESHSKVGELINAPAETIVFTSSASEVNNLAIKGYLEANENKGKHIVVSEIEHFSVLNLCQMLRNKGYETTTIKVDEYGFVKPAALKKVIREDTVLISIQHASSEIGTIQNIHVLYELAKTRDIYFHCDATASGGNIAVDVQELGVDALTLSGHNFYGPKGVGALYVKNGVRLNSQIVGGNQESGLRSGTENIPAIVGMATAAELARAEMLSRGEHLRKLQTTLWDGLKEKYDFLHFTGHPDQRLPGNVSFWVEYIEGESLLLMLNISGIQTASGSACSSNLRGEDEDDLAASHILTAVGVPAEYCSGSLTVSMGKDNTAEQVQYMLEVFPGIVDRLLSMSPLYADKMKGKDPYS